ncbi:oligosaccharide repeat unit polymerase [Chromobacterium violaceum]|uniref:oligosaccharide repeat unit polymerase n=1 Tax=Chromobacterium violaceum TaxID=536 RepID=UPI001BEBA673|nr:oligosaccharide repeat unit polymerase [Chromobacterium violaceum]MBT2869259.1 oligosaccharide repeat unit polymerase [Chromobacterium violaceum]
MYMLLNERRRATFSVLLIFISAAIICWLYTVFTDKYNGDFVGVKQELGVVVLTISMIGTVLPYIFLFCTYSFFSKRPSLKATTVKNSTITNLHFFAMAWFIFITIKFGAGIMGQPLYEPPPIIGPLIQCLNRINPFYVGVLFILCYKGPRLIFTTGIVLLICLGVLRGGLGVFLYVGTSLAIRYYLPLLNFLKKNKISCLFIAMVIPFVVSILFSYRDEFRGTVSVDSAEYSVFEMLIIRFIGRLSSFSDSAMVLQSLDYFSGAVKDLDHLYYLKQAFGGIFGVAFIPDVIPERLLVNIFGGDFFDVSYMTGVSGNFLIAWQIDPFIACFNLLLTMFMCLLTFLCARLFRFEYPNEYAFLLLLYPITSGVGNEFSSIIIALIFIWMSIMILNCIVPSRNFTGHK